jgi:hypothetical protein
VTKELHWLSTQFYLSPEFTNLMDLIVQTAESWNPDVTDRNLDGNFERLLLIVPDSQNDLTPVVEKLHENETDWHGVMHYVMRNKTMLEQFDKYFFRKILTDISYGGHQDSPKAVFILFVIMQCMGHNLFQITLDNTQLKGDKKDLEVQGEFQPFFEKYRFLKMIHLYLPNLQITNIVHLLQRELYKLTKNREEASWLDGSIYHSLTQKILNDQDQKIATFNYQLHLLERRRKKDMLGFVSAGLIVFLVWSVVKIGQNYDWTDTSSTLLQLESKQKSAPLSY